MKFIGFRKGVFESDGKKFEYANVYFTDARPDVHGVMAIAHKATLDVVDSLQNVPLGSECKVYFDQYKRVNLVVAVDGAAAEKK